MGFRIPGASSFANSPRIRLLQILSACLYATSANGLALHQHRDPHLEQFAGERRLDLHLDQISVEQRIDLHISVLVSYFCSSQCVFSPFGMDLIRLERCMRGQVVLYVGGQTNITTHGWNRLAITTLAMGRALDDSQLDQIRSKCQDVDGNIKWRVVANLFDAKGILVDAAALRTSLCSTLVAVPRPARTRAKAKPRAKAKAAAVPAAVAVAVVPTIDVPEEDRDNPEALRLAVERANMVIKRLSKKS
jgi:hypothetical protein